MANGQLDQFLRRYRQDALAADDEQSDAQLLQRFATRQDQAAFEALVRRHGPMVLGLCRRLLHNATDAEDAFQATFVVLVRKAGAIAQPDLLGNWLYGVAYRVAVRARANAARRTAHERQAASMPKAESTSATPDRELREVLDEEINRLPEKYRAPLILCYLEGKTNEQAARQLGCPVGSMSWRLARGREMLRQRLNRRQLAFSPLLFPPALAQHTSAAALPSSLVQSTVQVAVKLAQGGAVAAGSASASAHVLAEETLKAWRVARAAKIAAWAAASLLGLLLLLFGAHVLVAYLGTDGPPLPAVPCAPNSGG